MVLSPFPHVSVDIVEPHGIWGEHVDRLGREGERKRGREGKEREGVSERDQWWCCETDTAGNRASFLTVDEPYLRLILAGKSGLKAGSQLGSQLGG